MSEAESGSVKPQGERYEAVEVEDPSAGHVWVFHVPYWYKGAWRTRGRNSSTGERTSFTIDGVPEKVDGDVQKARKRARDKIANKAIRLLTESSAATKRRIPLAEAVTKFLDEKNDGTRRASTIAHYRMILERMILPVLTKAGVETPEDITRDHVVEIVQKMKTTGGREHSLCTRSKYLMLLRFFLKWCLLNEYVTRNIAMTYEGPKPKAIKKAQKKAVGVALTEAQARQLLNACREPFGVQITCENGHRAGSAWELTFVPPEHLFLAVLIALRTGLRLGNITGLRVEHLRDNCTILRIPDDEMKANQALRVPIHPELQPYLRQALKRIREEKGRAPVGKDQILGHVKYIRQLYDRALKRAGLETIHDEDENVTKRVRFHDLRHTFITWLEPICGSQEHSVTTKILVGHTRSDVTEGYSHFPLERLRTALNRLPYLLPPASEAAAPASSQGA